MRRRPRPLHLLSLESRLTPADIGGIDTTFGNNGLVTIGFDQGSDLYDSGGAVGIQSDGKIIIAGTALFAADKFDFAITRLLPSGQLDTTFGTNGRTIVRVGEGGNPNSFALGLVVTSDDRIILAGHSQITTDNDDFAIIQLDANGGLDSTFDGDGIATVAFDNGGNNQDRARSLLLQPDGKIVVVGFATGSQGNDNFAIARLNPDGSLDSTFNGDGRKTVVFNIGGQLNDRAFSAALQSDGNLVVTGPVQVTDTDWDFGVVRLLPDGKLDDTFSGDGKTTISINQGGNDEDKSRSVVLQDNGKILIQGYAEFADPDYDFALARLNSDGTLDTTYDGDGILTVRFDLGGSFDDRGRTTIIQPDGRILAAGFANIVNLNDDFAVARLETDGTLDTTFGTNGVQTITFDQGGDLTDRASDLILQADGGILVVGRAMNAAGNSDFAITRLFSAADTPEAVPPPPPVPVADVSIIKTDNLDQLIAGNTITYTITVSNAGPDEATGVTLTDLFPNVTGVSWSAVFSGGATGTANGTGTINESITLPSGSSITYTATATVPASFRGVLTNSATLTIGPDTTDPNSANNSASDSTTITAPSVPPPPPPGAPAFAVGSGAGIEAEVIVYRADGSEAFRLKPFTGFTGGVRVTMGDVDGDGVLDLVTATGPGRATLVRVYSGATQQLLQEYQPFEATFTGGLYVSTGDINGDGRSDIAISPDEGGGPRVRLFSGADQVQIDDYFGIDDPNFRGGARAAIVDLNGDGIGDLLVAAGFGGGPRLAGFDGKTLGGQRIKLFDDFFVFEAALRNGVFIAGGDLDGDGKAEVVAGAGPGGGPRVTALDGQALIDSRAATQTADANFFAGDTSNRGGVRVVVRDINGDGVRDIITGSGDGAGSRITVYPASGVNDANGPLTSLNFEAFPGFLGGVFVG